MRLLPPAGPGDVSMDMIIAPLPFRRQKGASIVACRADACGVASRRDGGPTLGEPASESWMGIEDGRGQVRTGEDG